MASTSTSPRLQTAIFITSDGPSSHPFRKRAESSFLLLRCGRVCTDVQKTCWDLSRKDRTGGFQDFPRHFFFKPSSLIQPCFLQTGFDALGFFTLPWCPSLVLQGTGVISEGSEARCMERGGFGVVDRIGPFLIFVRFFVRCSYSYDKPVSGFDIVGAVWTVGLTSSLM